MRRVYHLQSKPDVPRLKDLRLRKFVWSSSCCETLMKGLEGKRRPLYFPNSHPCLTFCNLSCRRRGFITLGVSPASRRSDFVIENVTFLDDGSMTSDQREKSLEKIRESKTTRVILISFKAGSTGLFFDHSILYNIYFFLRFELDSLQQCYSRGPLVESCFRGKFDTLLF